MALSQADKDKIVSTITSAMNQEWPIFTERWRITDKVYEYLRSKQYTDEEIAYYEAQKRPVNVFNVMFEKFNHILGDQFLSDQAQRVIAKKGGSKKVALIWERLLDHWHEENEYREQMGRTCLAGWIHSGAITPRWSNEHQIDGSIVYTDQPMDCLMWDSRAQSYFVDDAKYMIRWAWMSPSDILNEKRWSNSKEKLGKLFNDPHEDDVLWSKDEWKTRNGSDPRLFNKKNGQYMVVEFHEMIWEKIEVALDMMTGEANILDIQDTRRRDVYLKANPNLKVVERTEKVKYITTIIPALNWFLEKRKADTQDKRYDIILYHPYHYALRAVDMFGMGTVLLGPQNYINDLQNRMLDITNKSANAGVEFIEEAYDNPEDMQYAGAAGIILKKKKSFAPYTTFRKLESPTPPAGFERLLQDALYFFDMLTTSENQMGRKETANEPASLFAQRVAQAQIRFAVPNYWLNSVKRRLNNKIIRMTQSNLATPKMFLVTGEDGQQGQIYVNIPYGDQVLNNLQTGEYEVAVDDLSKTPMTMLLRNQRKAEFVELLERLFGPNAAQVIDWQWFLEDSNLGPMDEQIQKLMQFVQGMAAQQGQASALLNTNALLDTVQKNVALQDSTPSEGGTGKPSRQSSNQKG